MKVSSEQKVYALLSYLWILFLIPLLVKKKDKFVKAHAKQGLMLFICWIVVMMLAIIPLLGWILAPILNIILLIVSIFGIVKSVTGKSFEIPYVGKYAKAWKL